MKNTMKLPDKIKRLIGRPWLHLVFLACLLIFVYSQSTIVLMDDNVFYQKFTEKLANEGQFDFSLPGFHGGDFLTVPIYWLTHSPYSVAYLEMLLAVLSIFVIYLAAKEIYQNKAWGVIAAYIYLLCPFEYANPLRGHHHASMIFLTALGVYLLLKNNRFAWLAFGISYIIRPFAVALAPLFLYQRKLKQFFLSLAIPAVYVAVEYWQIGKVQIGVHENFTPNNLFSIQRLFMNLAYAFQNYFSIHSYSFLNCLGSYDLAHLSPFITFLALLSALYYKKRFTNRRLFFALVFSAAIALVLPAALVHLDMWYLWVFNFCLIILALPALGSHRLFPPIVAASFFFQFFYAYLSYRDVYWHNYAVFAVPILIFIASLIYAFMSKPKKEEIKPQILIATGIYPPDIGGPATIIKNLAQDLRRGGFAVGVITYSQIHAQSNDEVIRINKNIFGSKIYYFLRLLVAACCVDIIYVTDTYSVGYFAWLIKKLTGKKYIVRFAGDSAWETAAANGWTTDYIIDFAKKKYDSKIEKLKERRQKILADADVVIAVSNFMGDLAKLIGTAENKIKVIYNSVGFMDIPEPRETQIKLPQDGKIIMTACRLTKWKGVDLLIDVLPEIRNSLGKIYLVVLGDGPEAANLKKSVKELKLEESVIFLDRITHEEILDYYRRADVFVLNTNYEGLSHTLLEVMLAGTPIVATNVGGNPEVIENNKEGLLVGYGRKEELKEAIVKILKDKELADSFVSQAKEKLKSFNWRGTVAQTAAVLKKLL